MTETGMAILLVYGAEIFPPRDGRPGIDILVHANGVVELTAVGYPDWTSADTAIVRAERTCLDAGLQVARTERHHSRLVRRKS